LTRNRNQKRPTFSCAGDGRVDDRDGVSKGIFALGCGKVETLDVDFRRIFCRNFFGESGETGDCGSLAVDPIDFGDVVRRSPKIFFDRGVVLGVVLGSHAGYSITDA